jgi:hypothetical protein
MLGSSWVAPQLAASEEGLSTMSDLNPLLSKQFCARVRSKFIYFQSTCYSQNNGTHILLVYYTS